MGVQQGHQQVASISLCVIYILCGDSSDTLECAFLPLLCVRPSSHSLHVLCRPPCPVIALMLLFLACSGEGD